MQLQHPIRLIPAALLLAAAPAAFAQSSVTIYGVVDVYTAYQKSTVGGKDTSLWAMGNNGQMTSRLGFKGVEDLGGGYRASFNLETGFDPSTGGLQTDTWTVRGPRVSLPLRPLAHQGPMGGGPACPPPHKGGAVTWKCQSGQGRR